MDGLLVIDKPVGPTSHDVVARVRRILRERRIGHTGTLDPGASGVLPLVVGRATRLARFLSAAEKSYEAVVRLGLATDTGDSAGLPVGSAFAGPLPERDIIARALDAFRGTYIQQPPAYSAKKIGGQRSYRLARAASGGQSLALSPPLPAPVRVTVHALEVLSVRDDLVVLRIDCSAGFYVRGLARDLGEHLGIGAHLAALRRTRSGDLTLADATALVVLEQDPSRALAALVPLARMLPALTPLILTDEGARRAGHGLNLGPADFEGGRAAGAAAAGATPYRLLDRRGDLVGVAVALESSELLHPAVVLV